MLPGGRLFFIETWLIGVFGTPAFAVGLAGGIFALKRKQFAMSIFGAYFVMFFGIWTFASLASESYSAIGAGLLLGFPIIILSVLSLAFIAAEKEEFA